MNIHQTLIGKTLSVQEPVQTIKVGQILSGRILKLYPNNKAQIQLGNVSFIAQLEASLSVGSSYYFQVMTKGNVIQLKVIGDPFERKKDSSLNRLLHYIGVKPTKVNEDFIHQLIRKGIAIDPNQIKQATDLLRTASSKDQSQAILFEMFKNNLPITKEVYSALERIWTSSFSKQITSLRTELIQNESIPASIKQNIENRLYELTSRLNIIPTNLLNQISTNSELFHGLKGLGIIQPTITYQDWISQISQIESSETKINLAIKIDHQTMFHLLSNYEQIVEQANLFLRNWSDTISTVHQQTRPLTDEMFHRLKVGLEQFFQQHLKEGINVSNDLGSIRDLIVRIEWIAKLASTPQLSNVYHDYIRALFRDQAKKVLNDVGLQYEKVIYRDEANPTNTLKGLLLQLWRMNDSSAKGIAGQFLQYVNGLQIQSINETDKFLQTNILLPGQAFGLKNDISLAFQGQKNERGEVNPDYCRVVFVIELEHINETVIDMHVQKRAVTLQIMNDTPLIEIANTVKPFLKSGLERLGYQLSSITFQPHHTSVHKGDNQNQTFVETNTDVYQGVDFRV